MCLNRIDFVASPRVPQGMISRRAFRAQKRPGIDINSSPRNQSVPVCNDTCLRRSICSMHSTKGCCIRTKNGVHMDQLSFLLTVSGPAAREDRVADAPAIARIPGRLALLGCCPSCRRFLRLLPTALDRHGSRGCDHCRNHRPSFIPAMNGRPRCRRQPTTSKPSIPSSGVRSSTGQRRDWRHHRCWSSPERALERPTPSPIGSPI